MADDYKPLSNDDLETIVKQARVGQFGGESTTLTAWKLRAQRAAETAQYWQAVATKITKQAAHDVAEASRK